jgi:acyl carrier protein
MQLESEIKQFIIENFMFGEEDYSFREDDSFLKKGLIDSTGVLELVAFVEEKYALAVEDEELVPENFDSISRLAEYIRKKTNGGSPPCTAIS